MALQWLADALRAAGLAVVEHDGWKTRARPGTWEPRYGVVHATAAPRTQSDDVQIRIVRDGRSDLSGPIAVACVDRQGRWHVLGSGRCNTTITGTAGPYKGLGNTYALGVEACNDNASEPWPAVQYDAYARGWAAICRRLNWGVGNLVGHKEHTPGHKTDPTFGMGQFRAAVAGHINGGGTVALSADQEKDIWEWTALLVSGSTEPRASDRFKFRPPFAAINTTLARLESTLAAATAADEVRDKATLAAIQAITTNGGPDAAPIVAAINTVRDEARVEYARLHDQLAAVRAENTALRERLAAAARAEADQLDE